MFAIIHFRLNVRFFGSSAAKIERIFHNAKYFEEIFDFLLIFYAFSLLFAVFLPFLCVFLPACNQCTVSKQPNYQPIKTQLLMKKMYYLPSTETIPLVSLERIMEATEKNVNNPEENPEALMM